MRILVTGGGGFIGANLVRHLVDRPSIEAVVVLDNFSTGKKENLEGVDCDLVVGSFLDEQLLDEIVPGVDAVVHLGARPSVPRSVKDPVASHEANATGTINVLEAVRKMDAPYVIVASSSSVYGANTTLPKQEDLATRPVSPYAASKLATEAYTLSYGHSYDVGVLAFRFFNVFGPFQATGHAYAAVVPAFVEAALEGRSLPVHSDGQQSRDFTFVGTVSEVIGDACENKVTSLDPVNLAFGSRTNLLAIITILEELLGESLPVEHFPVRAGDVRHTQADSTKLHDLFPDVEAVDLRAGLEQTLNWYRQHLAMSKAGSPTGEVDPAIV